MGLINIAKFCGRVPTAYEQSSGEETPELFSDWPNQGQKYEGRGITNKYCACPTSILSPCRDRYNPDDGILYRRSDRGQGEMGLPPSSSSTYNNSRALQNLESVCSAHSQREVIDTGFIEIQPDTSSITSEPNQPNHHNTITSYLLPKRLLIQRWYNPSSPCSPNQDGNIGTEVKDKAYISTLTDEDWIRVTVEESPALSPTLGLDQDISGLSLAESEYPIPCQRNSRDNIGGMSDSLFTLPSSMENTQLLCEIQELGLECIRMDNTEDDMWYEGSEYFLRDTHGEGKHDDGYIFENPEMIILQQRYSTTSQGLWRDSNPCINESLALFRGRSVSAPEIRLLPSYKYAGFDDNLIQQSSRPAISFSESTYELHDPSVFLEIFYPIRTPYPALDSSATTLNFGFRPTLEIMPTNWYLEETDSSSQYNNPFRTQHQPRTNNHTDNTKGNAAENREYKLLHFRGGAKTPDHAFDTFFDIFDRTRKEGKGQETKRGTEVGKQRLDETMGFRDLIIAGQWGKQPTRTWREFIGAGKRRERKKEKERCDSGGGDGDEVGEKVVCEEETVVEAAKGDKSLEDVDMKGQESKAEESKEDEPKDESEEKPEEKEVESSNNAPKVDEPKHEEEPNSEASNSEASRDMENPKAEANRKAEATSGEQLSMEKPAAGTQSSAPTSDKSKETELIASMESDPVKSNTEERKLDEANDNNITPEKHLVKSEEPEVVLKPLSKESNTDKIQAAQGIKQGATDELKKSEETTGIKTMEGEGRDENKDRNNHS